VAGLREMAAVAARLARVHGVGTAAALIGRKWMRKLRDERLPNTPEANREIWDTHDWSRGGDEWTPSPEWKDAILDDLMAPHIPAQSRVLEIGPGAGRWTEHLLNRCSLVRLVDVSPVCIRLCRERFGSDSRIEYHLNDGSSLGFLEDGTVDAIWSFDTFVHIARADVERYVAQFPRVLSPGGVAVIHHSAAGVYRPSWRSDMTTEAMREVAAANGLEVTL
jgi:SAM-dependent methyltransferase